MNLSEKVSYLKGLMEGLSIDESTKEGKILTVMADILSDVAVSVEDMQDQVDEVVDVVEMLDDDLGELEKDYYEFDDCCDDECDCYDDEDDDDIYEVVCPTCGDTICLNEGMLEEGSMTCPGCGELLEFDLDDEDED